MLSQKATKMETSIDAVRIARRVLTAITNGQQPDAADVESLQAYAPSLAGGPVDALAHDVIQQFLQRRVWPTRAPTQRTARRLL